VGCGGLNFPQVYLRDELHFLFALFFVSVSLWAVCFLLEPIWTLVECDRLLLWRMLEPHKMLLYDKYSNEQFRARDIENSLINFKLRKKSGG
jgi:hypothetical protein